jgi:hypothetical protein
MTQLDRIEEKLDSVLLTLHGAPTESEKGLVVRVDRLEQAQKRNSQGARHRAGPAIATMNVLALIGGFISGLVYLVKRLRE